MPSLKLGLRAKFILLIIIGLSLIFIIIAMYVTRVTTNNLRNALVNESKTFSSLATKPIGETFIIYQDSGRVRITQQVERFTDLDKNIDNVAVVNVNGEVLYQQNENQDLNVNTEQASSFEPIYVYDDNKLSKIIYPYLEDFGAHRYSVVYSVSNNQIESNIAQLQRGVFIVATLALSTTIVIAYLLISKLFINPLSKVSSTATKISEGNLELKIEAKGNDETSDLARSVNKMAEALKADIRKLKEVDAIKSEFMMIASHNLRTPLAIVQGYLDTLLLSRDLPANVRETVEVVAASGNRLSVFAEDILTISRLEAGENVMQQREKIDLKDLLEQIGKDFKPLTMEKKLIFETNLGKEACEAFISRPHIRAAVWNLLDNALKFTTKGTIMLSLVHDEHEAQISIKDTGEGIAPEEVPKLFTKFHRGTSTLQYNFEGTGLGLYLTKLIIDQHQGRLDVKTKLEEGTTFVIHLPLAEDLGSRTEA